MKETILGFDQRRSVELGLDVIDLMLLDVLLQKQKSDATEKTEIDGEQYVWVNYKSIVEWLPILGLKKRALALRLNGLVEKGLVAKRYVTENGSYTYFRFLADTLQGGCNENCKGGVTKIATKYNTEIKETEKKEKDNNKLLSKKKEIGEDFETAFKEFADKAATDNELQYNLRSYKISNLAKLIDSFKTHVRNRCRLNDFVNNGYMKNRRWLLNAMPYLDITAATGLTLGKGEYLKDNRRYYINPAGRECEVPLDAPPRLLRDQIWYAKEQRWGPNV